MSTERRASAERAHSAMAPPPVLDAPMVVAVRCRALNANEVREGRQRFPARSDTNFACVTRCATDARTISVVDPDSVGCFSSSLPTPPNAARGCRPRGARRHRTSDAL